MMLKKWISACLGAAGMLVLILDGQTALSATVSGVDLCLRTVVPSLFPFLFLCALLTDSLWGGNFPLLRPLGKRLGIPTGAESLLMAAFLGGYPAGALAVGDGFREGKLTKQDAEHFLTFCSNAGPAFLFGMTALQFPQKSHVWALWLILILSSMLTGLIFHGKNESKTTFSAKEASVSQILNRTVRTMSIICGWIILFRLLSEFLNRWFLWYFPEEIRVIITGLLELSNGCCALGQIGNTSARFLVCALFLSFGGLCVAMQTASVIGGLSMKPYLLGKLTQTVLTLLLSTAYLQFGWWILGAVTLFVLIFPLNKKKEVDFQGYAVYNADITTGRKLYAVSKKD